MRWKDVYLLWSQWRIRLCIAVFLLVDSCIVYADLEGQ